MCIIISIANIMQTLLISGLKMMIMLLWPCLSLRHKPLPSTLEIDLSPNAPFFSSIGLKQASGSKIHPPVLFSPLFRGLFSYSYATQTYPLFICQPCIPCYIYYTNFWRYFFLYLLLFFGATETELFWKYQFFISHLRC